MWNLEVKANGVIDIPDDLWEHLRRSTGRKSKKRRHVKKAIRKLFTKIVLEHVKTVIKNNGPHGAK